MAELITHSLFSEIAALLILAGVVGMIGHLLKQPLVVSYIVVGILAGPAVLGVAQSEGPLELLSDLGIAILLFLVGLKMDYRLIRSLGFVSLTTGLGQVLFTSVFGFLIALALGFDTIPSLFIAVALTFSSTIIIVKLLTDKRELDSLHGRVALGFLIVQDIVVVLAMVVLSTVGIGSTAEEEGTSITGALTAVAVMGGIVFLIVRYAATPLTRRLAESQELLILFSIGLAAVFAAVGEYLGLGLELGGLFAGVALASTPFRDSIGSRLAPLRDFLLLFFFIVLGAQLDLAILGQNIPAAMVLSAFVLIGNPLIVLIIMGLMGYRKRTAFLAGLTVAQISEFSLIFIGLGLTLGQVTEAELSLVTLVGLITIAVSTYMITYSHKLFDLFGPYLDFFERKKPEREEEDEQKARKEPPAVILFGLSRLGGALAHRLLEAKVPALAIDYDPTLVEQWQERGLDAVYGDASDPEHLAELPLESARLIISTISHHGVDITAIDSRLTLIRTLKAEKFEGKLAVTVYQHEDMEHIRTAGADFILEPFEDAADTTMELIQEQIAGLEGKSTDS
ncbi:Kef-type K+ transport system membrane component KefB [Polymorphobacter multimanifer]|uniref:Kef-type K+ transport system membrane component KefB n=1 Tax=Polymorphobacter multimanifer TaxID=1070431 RepID=A0A841LAF8_9SPHN|nr:cation:proton antiporter family protein [Polymorphobacter multimanifer]MBB6229116.1 Kef-type K+ transport system membrane component KefB [Polymorphobacter multimanifer]